MPHFCLPRMLPAIDLRFAGYAIGITRLLELMQEAGFAHSARLDGAFYQPVLVGTKTD